MDCKKKFDGYRRQSNKKDQKKEDKEEQQIKAQFLIDLLEKSAPITMEWTTQGSQRTRWKDVILIGDKARAEKEEEFPHLSRT